MALTDSLVAYYALDGDGTDATGNGHTLGDGLTFGAGKIGQGATGGGGVSASGFSFARPFSVSFWCRPPADGGGSAGEIIAFDGFSPRNGVSVRPGVATADVELNVGFGTTGSAAVVAAEEWHHVVGVFTAAGTILYVNGSQSATGSAAEAGTHATLNVTPRDEPDTVAFDEIGVWSRALSAAEVTALYNGGAGLAYPFAGGAVSGAASVAPRVSATLAFARAVSGTASVGGH